jgi:hypothetical protein
MNQQSTAGAVMPALHVGTGRRLGALDVFPVWTDAPITEGRRYGLPLGPGVAVVSEVEEGPRVDTLVVDNPGAEPLLLLEGMTLDGGMQHRVLTSSILVAAGSRTAVPVRCIEQSRWSGSRRQRVAAYESPISLRSDLRTRGSDQGSTWRRVAMYERRHGTSPTNSLSDLLEDTSQSLRDGLEQLRPLPSQRGVVIAALGHPVLAEVVDHPSTLAERWDALIAPLSADVAHLPYVPTPGRRVRDFVQRTQAMPLRRLPGAGIGASLVCDEDPISLHGICDDAGLLHASVLNMRHELTLVA